MVELLRSVHKFRQIDTNKKRNNKACILVSLLA
jgi:hypothetical protein